MAGVFTTLSFTERARLSSVCGTILGTPVVPEVVIIQRVGTVSAGSGPSASSTLRAPIAHRLASTAVMLVVAAVALALGGTRASAHTGFDSSIPADGDAVDAPVDVVTVVFTGEPTPVGDGFTALTPQGTLQQPATIENVDFQAVVRTSPR